MTAPLTFGSYEQYRIDTKRYILWLVVTARAAGHSIRSPATLLQEATKSLPSTRKKGKARKTAQVSEFTEAAPSIATMASSKAKYPITTTQILKLAEYIGHQKRTVTMPKFVQLSWKRAVATREKYAESYAKEECVDQVANDGHIYFLWVLRRCHEILKDKVKAPNSKLPATVEPASRLHAISTTLEAVPKPVETHTGVPEADPATEVDVNDKATQEAEQEASHNELEKMARNFELDMKTKIGEELALRKTCLADDMRKVVEQLTRDWEDTHKDPIDEGYLDEVRATLMTEAALELISYQEMVLAKQSDEESLGDMDSSLATDEFFGKTARSLARIEGERKLQAGAPYPLLMSRLTAQEIETDEFLPEEEYEFLVHYLHEANFELDVKKVFSKPFVKAGGLPLLDETLDSPTQSFSKFGRFKGCSMAMVFIAELVRRYRSKDTSHSLKSYMPLIVRAGKEEASFLSWQNRAISFSPHIQEVTVYTRTLRNYIISRPFSHSRHIQMRLLGSSHPLCGLHHDYPKLRFMNPVAHARFNDTLVAGQIPDLVGDKAARERTAAQYILPPQDGDFLRMTIPTNRGKLSLAHGLLREKMGTEFADLSPQVFSLCHLYNCFKQHGLITVTWPDLELVTEWHLNKIFLKKLPTKPAEFFSLFLVATGYSQKTIKEVRNMYEDPTPDFDVGTGTHKTLQLETPPMMKVLREYIYGIRDGLRTWYRLDEEMFKHSKTTSRTEGHGEINILSFIKALRNSDQLRGMLPRFEFDYIGLTLRCGELCHKIDVEQGKIAIGAGVADESEWIGPTTRGFSIVATVLGDLDRVYLTKKQAGKKGKGLPDTTPIVDVAIREMRKFIDGL